MIVRTQRKIKADTIERKATAATAAAETAAPRPPASRRNDFAMKLTDFNGTFLLWGVVLGAGALAFAAEVMVGAANGEQEKKQHLGRMPM